MLRIGCGRRHQADTQEGAWALLQTLRAYHQGVAMGDGEVIRIWTRIWPLRPGQVGLQSRKRGDAIERAVIYAKQTNRELGRI